MSSPRVAANCRFETDRLRVAPWHEAASEAELDLPTVVAAMLTARATASLPEAWRGDFSVRRASEWIEERDQESPTLLVADSESGLAVGFVMLADVSLDGASVDVRIGYLLDEGVWGRGLATELVAGLAHWARSQPSVDTLTAGVDATNPDSSRVLVKNGFAPLSTHEAGEAIYQLALRR